MSLVARASSSLTITLASLASSSSLTVGRCSAAIDNSTNLDEIVQVMLQVTTGGPSPSPTSGGIIEAWAFGELADGTWPDLFTAAYSGSDGGFTIRAREILIAGAMPVGSVAVNGTSNVPYTFRQTNLAALLGDAVRKCALFVVHSTGVALNSTSGNHVATTKGWHW